MISLDMIERTNEDWPDHLRAAGPQLEAALADLRAIVVAGLPYALSKWLPPESPQVEALSQEVAQETLLRVLDKLDTLEGRSKFTTWVHTIAVRIALTELRRQRWKDVSLEGMVEKDNQQSAPMNLLAEHGSSPEERVEGSDLMMRVQLIIQEELIDKQRQAMLALAVQGALWDAPALEAGVELVVGPDEEGEQAGKGGIEEGEGEQHGWGQ